MLGRWTKCPIPFWPSPVADSNFDARWRVLVSSVRWTKSPATFWPSPVCGSSTYTRRRDLALPFCCFKKLSEWYDFCFQLQYFKAFYCSKWEKQLVHVFNNDFPLLINARKTYMWCVIKKISIRTFKGIFDLSWPH